MVTVKEPQTYQQSLAMDRIAHQQLERNNGLPCFPPNLRTNVAFPCLYASDLRGLDTGQQDAVGGFLKQIPPYHQISYPTEKSALPHALGVTHKPTVASCSPQKRFLIFDQSGNHTRLFFSPSFSPKNQIIASINPVSANGSVAKAVAQVDKRFLAKSIVEEKWDENHLTDGEGEMLEDTEDIDALLYSDSDDEFNDDVDDDDDNENDEVTSQAQTPFSIQESYDKDKLLEELTEEVVSSDGSPKRDTEYIDALLYSNSDDVFDDDADNDDNDNDEVTSKGQTPFIIPESYNKDKLLEELTEEVASSDGSQKRQRLLDGSYKKSSLVSAESPLKRASPCYYEDGVESSCAGAKNPCDDIDMGKREKKVKIREALKILETIIPGLNSKDPLAIIDKAIVYLKSMKSEAVALELSYPGCKSATFL